MSMKTKVVVRLIAGPADGLVFSVPFRQIPPFVGFGAFARYERVAGEGDVISYMFTAACASHASAS
jgi:hypothetical protein